MIAYLWLNDCGLTYSLLQIFAAVAKHSLNASSATGLRSVPYSRNFVQRRVFSYLREEIPTDPASQVEQLPLFVLWS